ncbi:MAG: erythromycin esterase family protein [Gemmatimonadales bacterium]|nr:erythromycin esterase family protein [Gemmatimonadales bacterium]
MNELRSGVAASPPRLIGRLIRKVAEPISSIEDAELGPLLDRIGGAKVVLIGEASHGTSEFYRMRARITRELIERRGFSFVAVEADWPDARWIDHHVKLANRLPEGEPPFARFPTWMWRNRDVADFAEWLRTWNAGLADPTTRVGFFGLDLYSLHRSIDAVLRYLDHVDPSFAKIARERYSCLLPWRDEPSEYGHHAIESGYAACESAVVAMLRDLLANQEDYLDHDGERFFDAAQNARLVANAERYYRVMYYGAVPSWNLRDEHMFDTLLNLLRFHGPEARAVVWAHNSHIGDASATEMHAHGEHNLGQLCRGTFSERSYHLGFGTDRGTVAAASHWNAPMQRLDVRPAHPESYERLCREADMPAFLLPLGIGSAHAVSAELSPPRLERAIGVIYRPDIELQSHYFEAVLPRQFDEYVWFTESTAVTPIASPRPHGAPDTYPFGI